MHVHHESEQLNLTLATIDQTLRMNGHLTDDQRKAFERVMPQLQASVVVRCQALWNILRIVLVVFIVGGLALAVALPVYGVIESASHYIVCVLAWIGAFRIIRIGIVPRLARLWSSDTIALADSYVCTTITQMGDAGPIALSHVMRCLIDGSEIREQLTQILSSAGITKPDAW